jgi:hypothetical protein
MHPRNILALLAAATLASCATQPGQPEQPGRLMAVRDLSGKLLMQFDYPTDELCARTSRAMRGTIYKAGCAQTPAPEPLHGHATLRYNPPGVLVKGHYVDLAMCRTQTSQLSAGVELIDACTAS